MTPLNSSHLEVLLGIFYFLNSNLNFEFGRFGTGPNRNRTVNPDSNSLITENKGLAMAAQLLLLLIEGYYIRVFSFDEVTDQGTEA